MELLEVQALLEAERVSQTDPGKRGNSIFSEVEDRRQQVERHMSKLSNLHEREKRKNKELQSELLKVKVYFPAFFLINLDNNHYMPFYFRIVHLINRSYFYKLSVEEHSLSIRWPRLITFK